MKKFYLLFAVVFSASASFAQCVIDPAVFGGVTGGAIYPSAAHLPHIVQDSLYDQTVQGEMPDTVGGGGGGFVTLTIDSIRLDSVTGLPNGIVWIKNPNVLPGGGYGCVEFSGSTTDSAGTYTLSAIGMVWAHLSIPLLGVNEDTSQYGSLNGMPPFNNFYVVVDSVEQALSVTANSPTLCYGTATGTLTAFAAGGSPIAPYTYLWNNGATTYILNNVAAGSYTVTVYNGSDSATTTAAIAVEQSPVTAVTAADSGSTGTNGVAWVASVSGGTPPYTFRWSGGGGTGDTATGLAPGTYNVTVRDSLGCRVTDSVVVANLVPSGIAPVSEIAPQVTLFPNPANNVINMVADYPQTLSTRIEVADMTGRIVYSLPVTISGHYNQTLNTSQFGAGIYTLRILSGAQTTHQRFVVTH